MTAGLIHRLVRAALDLRLAGWLFRGAQMPGEAAIAAAAQRPVVVGVGGIVGMADEVGHRRIAQHSSAVGQRRAAETQHLSVPRLMLIGVESPTRIISVRRAMKALNSSSGSS